ncbi:MAG: hypothetical protein PHF57_11860, partial [Methanoregula sp.]|nr:hypothetical protein [Methanoregula sp.]
DCGLAGAKEGEFWICLFARVHCVLLHRAGADLTVLQCRCACGIQGCCRFDLPAEQRDVNFFARSMLSAGIYLAGRTKIALALILAMIIFMQIFRAPAETNPAGDKGGCPCGH